MLQGNPKLLLLQFALHLAYFSLYSFFWKTRMICCALVFQSSLLYLIVINWFFLHFINEYIFQHSICYFPFLGASFGYWSKWWTIPTNVINALFSIYLCTSTLSSCVHCDVFILKLLLILHVITCIWLSINKYKWMPLVFILMAHWISCFIKIYNYYFEHNLIFPHS